MFIARPGHRHLGVPVIPGAAPDVVGAVGAYGHGAGPVLHVGESSAGGVGGSHYGGTTYLVDINAGRVLYLRHRLHVSGVIIGGLVPEGAGGDVVGSVVIQAREVQRGKLQVCGGGCPHAVEVDVGRGHHLVTQRPVGAHTHADGAAIDAHQRLRRGPGPLDAVAGVFSQVL